MRTVNRHWSYLQTPYNRPAVWLCLFHRTFLLSGDHKLYIDLSFFHELSTKYGASGEFAMAYVIAHEVGHHVQTLLGLTDQVFSLKDRMSESEFNRYLVR